MHCVSIAAIKPLHSRGFPSTEAREQTKDTPWRDKGLTYAEAGVDIDAGNRMVELIKPLVRSTGAAGADAEIGGFGALFDLKRAGFAIRSWWPRPTVSGPSSRSRLKPARTHDRHRSRRHVGQRPRRAGRGDRCFSWTISPVDNSIPRSGARVIKGVARAAGKRAAR
jgi:hypothetical protein